MKPPALRDYRTGGLSAYCADHADAARDLMDAVLRGLPAGLGRVASPFLPLADRISDRWLARADDPYREEIAANRAALGRSGVFAFNLSYEWGCTSAALPGAGAPQLMRVLDWPFEGIGARVELVRLSGPAGEWAAATWPGVSGVLQAVAPGRFAAALNQAPERRSSLGRAAAWTQGRARVLRSRGWAPAHLLRHVVETAPTFAKARARLRDEPVCAPVIYTLSGTRPDEVCVIERLEGQAATHEPRNGEGAAAANHFRHLDAPGRWRPRGMLSEQRAAEADALTKAMQPDGLRPPVLNTLTRLAMTMSADGDVALCGYENGRPATGVLRVRL